MHTKFERLLSKSLTTLEVVTYYPVVHTGPGKVRRQKRKSVRRELPVCVCVRGSPAPLTEVSQGRKTGRP